MNKNLSLYVIVVLVLSVITMTTVIAYNPSDATVLKKRSTKIAEHLDAPVAISGDNTYIAWWTNETGNNDDVMFRSSNDGGANFSDKINISNTTAADSINAEIAADGSNVIVTWWERNSTSEEPVVRASTDSGVHLGHY